MSINSNGYSLNIDIRKSEVTEVTNIIKSKCLDYDIYGMTVTVSPIFCEDEAAELEIELNAKLAELRKVT
jgi:hypothetical protein